MDKVELHSLHEALRTFASSSRFSFLRELHVGPVLGDDASSLGGIAQMTFSELVEAAERGSPELAQVSETQGRVLITLLRALAEHEGEEGGSLVNASSGIDEGAMLADTSTPTTFNSVQCEQELRERLTALRGHPDLSRVKDQPLGRFWKDDQLRAPFEESLTIQQFLGLDIAVLTKKRTMTSARMVAMTRALENALTLLAGGTPPAEKPSSSLPAEAALAAGRHRWQAELDRCSPHDSALIESFLRARADGAPEREHVRGAMAHFAAAFSVGDFLSIIGGKEISTATKRKLVAWIHSVPLREITNSLHLMTQGVGVHISRLVPLVQGSDLPRAFYALGTILILRGMGATPVQLGAIVCPDVWTLNPDLLALVVREAERSRRGHFARAITRICPAMDPFLHEWVCRTVSNGKTRSKGRKRL